MCRVNGENTRQQIVGFSWFRLLFRINWWPESSQCHNLLSSIFSIYYRPSMPWWRSFKFLKHVWILFCCDFLSCKNKGSAALSLFTLFWCRLGKGRNNEQVAVSALSASWEAKWYPSSTANMMIYELWSGALAGTFRPQNAVLESEKGWRLGCSWIKVLYWVHGYRLRWRVSAKKPSSKQWLIPLFTAKV